MSEQQPTDYVDPTSSEQKVEVLENVSALTKLPGQSTDQLGQIREKVVEFISNLQTFLNEFFEEYRQILVLVLLLAGGGISLKLVLAILGAINEIPLLNPLFEIVGIGYTSWFIYRYLLKAESRQELKREIESLQNQIMGRKSE